MQLRITLLLTASLALAGPLPAFAATQSHGGQGGGQQAAQGMMQKDRLHTQDRMRDRIHSPDQDRDRDRYRDRDSDWTHDRNHRIYGYSLMTWSERMDYRNSIRNMKTLKERNAYRKQHVEAMRQRARERGVSLPGMHRAGNASGKP